MSSCSSIKKHIILLRKNHVSLLLRPWTNLSRLAIPLLLRAIKTSRNALISLKLSNIALTTIWPQLPWDPQPACGSAWAQKLRQTNSIFLNKLILPSSLRTAQTKTRTSASPTRAMDFSKKMPYWHHRCRRNWRKRRRLRTTGGCLRTWEKWSTKICKVKRWLSAFITNSCRSWINLPASASPKIQKLSLRFKKRKGMRHVRNLGNSGPKMSQSLLQPYKASAWDQRRPRVLGTNSLKLLYPSLWPRWKTKVILCGRLVHPQKKTLLIWIGATFLQATVKIRR